MGVNKQYKPERSTDPYWDQIIAAHSALLLHPSARLEIQHGDRLAKLYTHRNKPEVVVIELWMDNNEQEKVGE